MHKHRPTRPLLCTNSITYTTRLALLYKQFLAHLGGLCVASNVLMHSPTAPMQPLKPPNARPCHFSKISLFSNAIPEAVARVLPKVHYLRRPRFEVCGSNTGSPRPIKISQDLLNLAHRKGLAQTPKQRQTMHKFFYTLRDFTPTQLASISEAAPG